MEGKMRRTDASLCVKCAVVVVYTLLGDAEFTIRVIRPRTVYSSPQFSLSEPREKEETCYILWMLVSSLKTD
jgi:hypothetical protein